jgi:hypothetical protein
MQPRAFGRLVVRGKPGMDDEAVAIAERAAGMVGLAALCALANKTSEWFLEGEIDHVEGNMQGSGNRLGRRRGLHRRAPGAQAHRRGSRGTSGPCSARAPIAPIEKRDDLARESAEK